MARIAAIELNLDMKNKEDLDLYHQAMDGKNTIVYEGRKYVVKSVTINSIDSNKATVILYAAEQ